MHDAWWLDSANLDLPAGLRSVHWQELHSQKKEKFSHHCAQCYRAIDQYYHEVHHCFCVASIILQSIYSNNRAHKYRQTTFGLAVLCPRCSHSGISILILFNSWHFARQYSRGAVEDQFDSNDLIKCWISCISSQNSWISTQRWWEEFYWLESSSRFILNLHTNLWASHSPGMTVQNYSPAVGRLAELQGILIGLSQLF